MTASNARPAPHITQLRVDLSRDGKRGEQHTVGVTVLDVNFRANRFLYNGTTAKVLFVRGRRKDGSVAFERLFNGEHESFSVSPGSTIEVVVRFLQNGCWTGLFTGPATSEE